MVSNNKSYVNYPRLNLHSIALLISFEDFSKIGRYNSINILYILKKEDINNDRYRLFTAENSVIVSEHTYMNNLI